MEASLLRYPSSPGGVAPRASASLSRRLRDVTLGWQRIVGVPGYYPAVDPSLLGGQPPDAVKNPGSGSDDRANGMPG
jgi:hypothetical protein